MDQEQSWLSMNLGNDDNPVVDNYEYFMRPEPRENLGPIVEEFDELLQRKIKTREVRFGMVRNAKEEDKKTAKAYLEPYPHLRIEKAKPLQGWYKSLYEPPGVRNRPCFTEAILTEPYGGYCSVGCAFCCVEGTTLITPQGKTTIENIKVGDYVLGRCEELGFGEVLNVVSRTVKTTILVELDNDTKFEVTSDHSIWSESRKRWVVAFELSQGENVQVLKEFDPNVIDNFYDVPTCNPYGGFLKKPISDEVYLPEETEKDYIETSKIVKITVLKSPTKKVWDIQTTTENFYAEGTLVHNCYVNAGFRGYRGTGLITVPINYGEQIRVQLSKMRRSAAGYFSSFTDPFLPLEDYYHNTQRAAEEFVKLGLPIFFLSRLRYPNWAVDLLKQNKYSYAQKSINTPSPEDWRLLSPGALPLEEHLEDIARLRRNGIYVSIQCNPIVPGVVTHGDVIKLFEKLSKAGANHVIVKFVEAGFSWAEAMCQRITKRFGEERGNAFRELFTENIGGQKTIAEKYRLEGHKLYSTAAKRFGMTYATCYEYKMLRDAEGNIIDKTGVSIGREFTTADQCHGQRVPMFTRESSEENFKEVEECPPSGCLYCASENGGTSRCGDTLAGKAPALRLVDLKLPIKKSN